MRYLFLILMALGLVTTAHAKPDDQDPTLIGGEIADPADWPASPWIGNCSSTLIGENVLLTAAHCVGNGGTVRFSKDTTVYTGRCTHHSSYRRNSTADWALCKLTSSVSDVDPETVATAAEVECATGKRYLWTGYGCTRWGGRLDGNFRTGEVGVISCPSGSNHDTVTRGTVALCSGDSGGGGYVVGSDGSRKVIGVNSRSNTRDTSYVSSTYVSSFRDWAANWASSNSADICGINKDCVGEIPDPDPDPENCDSEMSLVESAVGDLKECLSSL